LNPQPFSDISAANSSSGRTSLVAAEIARYSLSVVDSAISLCSHDIQIMGHPGNEITKPVLDLAVSLSHLAFVGSLSLVKEAST
jgi:hypothetical protein